MMHGLGDVKKPLPESAAIVEELVHQQIVSFVLQASEVSQMRNPASTTSCRIELEDCLFLLRRNRVKLKRLYRYLKVRDLKSLAGTSNFDPADDSKSESKKKKTAVFKECIKLFDAPHQPLVSYLEAEDDDDEDVDVVKMERLKRVEAMSRRLSVQQYLEFTEARAVTFAKGAKGKSKFREWLFSGSRELAHLDTRVESTAMEIISYLARETVAEIVDLGFLVQQESLARIEDPVSLVKGLSDRIVKPDNPAPSSSAWDGVIPGLGGEAEKPLGESRGPLLPWHIREGVTRYLASGFGPFDLHRKSIDVHRTGRILLCA